MRLFLYTLTLFVFSAQCLVSQENKDAFSYMDLFDLQYASDPQISPDGQWVVYRRMGYDVMTDKSKGNLWRKEMKVHPAGLPMEKELPLLLQRITEQRFTCFGPTAIKWRASPSFHSALLLSAGQMTENTWPFRCTCQKTHPFRPRSRPSPKVPNGRMSQG